MQRLNVITNHIVSAPLEPQLCASGSPRPDDVVICCALRSALCKSKRGSFANTPPEDILAGVMRGVVAATKIDPKLIGDVVIGNCLQGGAGAVSSRTAQLMAGIPDTTPLQAINRQCSSGLQAVATVAGHIRAGFIEIGLAGGVENMSMNDMASTINPENISENVFEHEGARNCLMPMGITSENVAAKYGITREQQDQMAVESHHKAANAQKAGLFKSEIVPIQAKVKGKDGSVTLKTVDTDEGIRGATTLESLSKLRPAFQKGGSTTAGNSSQTTDGAACVLLASRAAAQKHGLPILATFRAFAVEGCAPEIMGIGPAVAIPAVLKQAGLTIDDIDIFEVNEAFASQATYCCDKLGIPRAKLNPKGGAIALGHPLGATGARQIATLLPELKRTNKKLGLISMCIGTGMGAAAVVQLE